MIVLDVKYTEKDNVKNLGARWDSVAKVWFIPPGLDVALFKPWLPASFDFTTIDAATTQNKIKEQRLCQYLAKFSAIIAAHAKEYTWIVAEISELKVHNHAYLTLVEHDDSGKLLARCNAAIWATSFKILNEKFKVATGSDLMPGIKVLIQVSSSLHVVYGFSLTVQDVDPNYTLGDLAAKLAAIREELINKKLYTLNKTLTKPQDFTRLAVIAPNNAAGLGDFKREADLLAKFNLCQFEYFTATFQGDTAASSIIKQLQHIEHAVANNELFDAIIIIRGGGALSDLAWLNDLELATHVCNATLPVMVGIGHERDYTILDEVANLRFDTPSKVIANIFHVITHNALNAAENWQAIHKAAVTTVRLAKIHSNNQLSKIDNAIKHILQAASNKVQTLQQSIINNAKEQHSNSISHLKYYFQEVLHYANINVSHAEQRINVKHQEMLAAAAVVIKFASQELRNYMQQILLQDPKNILNKGFALIKNANKIITTKQHAIMHSKFTIVFQDGEIEVKYVK